MAQCSLVIPVYNECESLRILHDKITQVMDSLDCPWEVVYVDDGSIDNSVEILRALQAEDPHVVVAVQRRNFGKSTALNTGFGLAQGEIFITMDSDLQDEPEEIPRLLEVLESGYDLVSGWKTNRQDPVSKTLPSRLANAATRWATGVHLRDMNSGFKVYRANCARSISLYGDLHRYIPALVSYKGYQVTEIPVQHHRRRFGRSKYGPGRLMSGGLDLMTVVFLNRFGRRPLHLLGSAGMLLFTVGFLINLGLSVEWLVGTRNLSERPLLILGVLLMLMGAQLLTIGLVAELIVSYMQRQEDPLNTVRQVYRAPVEHEIMEDATPQID